jgi:hypothetical protein
MSEFVWTDQLAQEYASICVLDGMIKDVRSFKESKQPKPEWEIVALKFVADGTIFQLPHYNLDKNNVGDENHTVHSVKRLSDGEAFTVGDEVERKTVTLTFDKKGTNTTVSPLKIEKFFTREDRMLVNDGADLVQLSHKPTAIPILLTSAQIEKLKNLLDENN